MLLVYFLKMCVRYSHRIVIFISFQLSILCYWLYFISNCEIWQFSFTFFFSVTFRLKCFLPPPPHLSCINNIKVFYITYSILKDLLDGELNRYYLQLSVGNYNIMINLIHICPHRHSAYYFIFNYPGKN